MSHQAADDGAVLAAPFCLSRAEQLQRLEQSSRDELMALYRDARMGVASEEWLVTSIQWDLAVV